MSLDRCHLAMQAEIRHYRAICHRADTRAALAAVRVECAGVLADALHADLDAGAVLPCLTDAIAYVAYPDVAEVLARLRGVRPRASASSPTGTSRSTTRSSGRRWRRWSTPS